MEAQANVVAFPSPHAIGIVKADIENGYTRMANDLVDALALVELSGRQYRVFMAIIRKTYGYNKKSDWMAAEQIQKAMGYTGDITHIRAD
ncbi:replication protein, partial [Hahella sp. HN01]|uniref:replication protein n=1 Tax=Hahella sp. HN01 TaxID=2847262 RepID=UPI001C1EFC95